MIAVTIIVSLPGCRNSNPAAAAKSTSPAITRVNVLKPTLMEGATRSVSYFGNLVANRKQTLGFSVPGQLTSIAGVQDRIREGAVIAELEHDQLKAQRDALRLNLDSAPTEEDRLRLEQQLAALEQRIRQHLVLAPFDCVVEATFVSQNSLIRPSAPVIEVVETAMPKIQIDFPRKVANAIEAGSDYEFWLDGEVLVGRMLHRSFRENPPGSVQVSFSITSDLSAVDFSLGQSVKARILLKTADSGYWLPLSSLQQDSSGLWTVFAIKPAAAGNIIEKQVVKIVQLDDDRALVAGELADQWVVRDGTHRIFRGQKVEPVIPPEENPAATSDRK